MQNSFFNKIKTIFKITITLFSFIRFLIIILLFVVTFNLLFTINFDTLKTLPLKEKILYIFKYPTSFIQVKKDSKNAIILISAIQDRFRIIQNYITGNENTKVKAVKRHKKKQDANLQKEEGYVKQAISEEENLVILRFDGTVVASGNNNYGQCNVSNWRDIYEIGVGAVHTVGLKKDGTVVATGNNDYGQCNVSGWRDIISIGAGNFHTVGLKEDGTVVATGNNDFGQCNVSKWANIIKIKIGENYSIGLQDNNKEFVVGKRTATMKEELEKMKKEEIEVMKREQMEVMREEVRKEWEREKEKLMEKEKRIKEEIKQAELKKEELKEEKKKKELEIEELKIEDIEY